MSNYPDGCGEGHWWYGWDCEPHVTVECVGCGRHYDANEDECPYCGSREVWNGNQIQTVGSR